MSAAECGSEPGHSGGEEAADCPLLTSTCASSDVAPAPCHLTSRDTPIWARARPLARTTAAARGSGQDLAECAARLSMREAAIRVVGGAAGLRGHGCR